MIKINADRIYADASPMYGLLYRSTMSGLNVIFCSTDEDQLLDLEPEITSLIEDIYDVTWYDYCRNHNLIYADDAGSENVLELGREYCTVKTPDRIFEVQVIGNNSFRF